MTNEPHEHLKTALLQPTVGIAFAWDEQTLTALDLEPTRLHRGPLYCFPAQGKKTLHALELKQDGFPIWPLNLTSRGVDFTRLIDRLYVPTPRDRLTTVAVFDACASSYESLINPYRNVQNITRLLDIIDARNPRPDTTLRVLDFGCGTGLSLQAIAIHPKPRRFDLYGLDASSHMRSIAESKGLRLVMGDEVQPYDGVFASYVLHGGLGCSDIEWLARVLSDKGVFAGNWLHGDNITMESFLEIFGRIRQGSGEIIHEENLWLKDPIVMFQVNES